ncbi:DEAD/DEAH box helicase [Caenispirillum bisanense]|uniref:DEAD/DEAH box helicase n=1 Tax=Caenispirillum bisanense TaxID=414052 RepID=UPI0031D3164A
MPQFAAGSSVGHSRFGSGTVELDKGTTSLVRFSHGFEECLNTELTARTGFRDSLDRGDVAPPQAVIARLQAAAIRSANDQWGVFSRSRIALLPHQLWVCRKVRQEWPTRWLIADDVGLGKTVEAGLILLPLISTGMVRRLLIMCPAGLVEQWQQRMRQMFDIRLMRYLPEADTDKADFWGTASMVVASFHTLRLDSNGRKERLLDAEPWDLVVVDEAHHLNADEKLGPTLAHELLSQMQDRGRVRSMVLFTGTPHRGKHFGFLSLMSLLRPDLFDPKRPIGPQLPLLKRAVIRNNKHSVTDMSGRKLFTPVTVHPETFSYSEEEDRFYGMMSEFILSGKAYASTLSQDAQQAVILVLITMQKLASSSVAAVRRALRGRLARLRAQKRALADAKAKAEELRSLAEDGSPDCADRLAELEERIAELLSVELMEDEEPRLAELLEAADAVREETKIRTVIDLIGQRFGGQQVLLFTEYKATQSLVMSALQAEFGDGCAGFINGDGRAEDVVGTSGKPETVVASREASAEAFNSGRLRFLVSTEAAGEGIDLQERCSILIHVDLPWNPMRLHQRVGRLSRYGQTKPVDVYTFRNPATVESLIWEKLNGKIGSIMQALGSVMDEPEDLLHLVLGMASPSMFTELFADADRVGKQGLSSWFDAKTSTLGGVDAISAVKDLIGNVQRFDFGEAGGEIPRCDLPDLKPFFLNMLGLNGRRPQSEGEGLSFKTPEAWLTDFVIRKSYSGMVFDRSVKGKDAGERVLGVGHRLFDRALAQAAESSDYIAVAEGLNTPLCAFAVRERVTTAGSQVRQALVGVALRNDQPVILRDWETLKLLNGLPPHKGGAIPDFALARAFEARAKAFLEGEVEALKLDFAVPEIETMGLLLPAQ